jgi:hypothetical protein
MWAFPIFFLFEKKVEFNSRIYKQCGGGKSRIVCGGKKIPGSGSGGRVRGENPRSRRNPIFITGPFDVLEYISSWLRTGYTHALAPCLYTQPPPPSSANFFSWGSSISHKFRISHLREAKTHGSKRPTSLGG